MHIRDLRQKILIVRGAFRIASDGEFARLIGINPTTLAGYMSDKAAGIDDVPADRVDTMAAFLADRMKGRLTFEHAHLAWRADLESFQLAVAPFPDSMFGKLLRTTPTSLPLSLHLRARRGAHDDEALPLDPEIERLPALSSFTLKVKARHGAYLVILMQSVHGWHLAAPRTPEPLRIGASGLIEAPPSGLRFFPEGGLYRFYAFAIVSDHVPKPLLRVEISAPLEESERNAFAVDLADRSHTKSFALGRLAVFVEPADTLSDDARAQAE